MEIIRGSESGAANWGHPVTRNKFYANSVILMAYVLMVLRIIFQLVFYNGSRYLFVLSGRK